MLKHRWPELSVVFSLCSLLFIPGASNAAQDGPVWMTTPSSSGSSLSTDYAKQVFNTPLMAPLTPEDLSKPQPMAAKTPDGDDVDLNVVLIDRSQSASAHSAPEEFNASRHQTNSVNPMVKDYLSSLSNNPLLAPPPPIPSALKKACKTSNCFSQTRKNGLHYADIEQQSDLQITRIYRTIFGDVEVDYQGGLRHKEILTIDNRNHPVIKTRNKAGDLVLHPKVIAGVHGNHVLIIDKSIPKSDLIGRTLEYNTVNLPIASNGQTIQANDMPEALVEEDLSRPMPVDDDVTKDLLPAIYPGQPATMNASQKNAQHLAGSPQEFANPTLLPAISPVQGPRVLYMAQAYFVLDGNGIIQSIYPIKPKDSDPW